MIDKMNETDEEYLKRFPSSLRNYLDNEDSLRTFKSEVKKEYQDVIVYRAIGDPVEVKSSDFLGNVEKRQLDGQKCSRRIVNDFHYHSVTVNESCSELIKATHFPNSHIKGIAKGKMQCAYGPADFEPHRGHHNWYLFNGMNEVVCRLFKPINTNTIV